MRFLPFILKNIRRHRLRSLFTVLSIAMSLFLVTLLYAYIEFQDELAARSRVYHRIMVTHVEGLTSLLPAASVDRIRAVQGVAAAAPLSWFGGLYQDEKIPFAQFATHARPLLDCWTEYRLDAGQLAAWEADRAGCVVGRKIAASKGWKLGDEIVLKGAIYDCDLHLTVRGIYDGSDTADLHMLWFHDAYLDELLKARRSRLAGRVGSVVVKARSAAAVPEVMRRIDELFANSDSPVRAMTEESFQQMFTEMLGNVQAFVRNTALAVVFSLVCVAANAMAMSLRERTRELAVLRAIGFQRSTVLALMLAESLLVALAGGALGISAVKLLFVFFDPGVLGLSFLTQFYVPWATALFGLGLAAFIGLASGFVPAWRAAFSPIVEGLRKVV